MEEDWYLCRAIGDGGQCRTVGLFDTEAAAAEAGQGLPDVEVVRLCFDALAAEAFLPCNGRCIDAASAGLPFGGMVVFSDPACPRHRPTGGHLFTPGDDPGVCTACCLTWPGHAAAHFTTGVAG